jgi:phenylacetaldehyde dehydrogenase
VRTPPCERARVLNRVADIIRQRAEELAGIESTDVGKQIPLSRPLMSSPLPSSTSTSRRWPRASTGRTGPSRSRRTPTPAGKRSGVVAAVTPFNFPLILSTSKIAPVLAAGNTVVHKVAPDTPLSALVMALILTDAGAAAATVNVLTGQSPQLGATLVRHVGVNKIAFTGSTSVAAAAGEALKPITLELGGNGSQIVFDDANVQAAVDAFIKGFVFNSGQFCMGAPRLLVARPLYETVTGILAQAVPGVPVGDPFDPATMVGPMAAERHLRNVQNYVSPVRPAGRSWPTASGSTALVSTISPPSSPTWMVLAFPDWRADPIAGCFG